MAISFNQIPTGLRVPGNYLEVDPSLAESGVGTFPLRALIIGQKTSAGSLAAATIRRITSKEQASAYAGPGSIASRMASAWFAGNRSTEIDLILLADAGGAIPNVRSISFGGVPAAGGLAVYVGGDRYFVDTSGALTATAALLAAAITANPESCMTAAVNPGLLTQVLLTAKNGGEVGNTIDVRVAHLAGETVPTGLTVTIATVSAGSGNPALTSVLAAIAGVQYDVIAHPFLDSSNLGLLETDLAGRAYAIQAIPGHAFTGAVGSQGVLAAIGNARNSENSTIVGFEAYPGVPCERAAQIAGLVAFYGGIDPARPFQTLSLTGFAPLVEDRFTIEERNLLLSDGIATTTTDRAGTVRIERLITTYQNNAAGAPSVAYLDVNTRLLLSFYRKSLAARIALRFPRHKLADDDLKNAPAPGSAIVTPKVFKAECVSHYRELLELGIVEDEDGFISNSTVERSPTDVNRIDAALAPNFVNQLMVGAVLVQFRL